MKRIFMFIALSMFACAKAPEKNDVAVELPIVSTDSLMATSDSDTFGIIVLSDQSLGALTERRRYLLDSLKWDSEHKNLKSLKRQCFQIGDSVTAVTRVYEGFKQWDDGTVIAKSKTGRYLFEWTGLNLNDIMGPEIKHRRWVDKDDVEPFVWGKQ